MIENTEHMKMFKQNTAVNPYENHDVLFLIHATIPYARNTRYYKYQYQRFAVRKTFADKTKTQLQMTLPPQPSDPSIHRLTPIFRTKFAGYF